MIPRRALILGINGQNGSWLADLLLQKKYSVFGLVRRSSCDNLWRIKHLLLSQGAAEPLISLYKGDLLDPQSVWRALEDSRPDEVYNLADQDHIDWSYAAPCYSWQVTAGAVGNLLEMIREIGGTDKFPTPPVFQPSSATIFGGIAPPQSENTLLAPASPYAIAKCAALFMARHYRREYGLHVSCGIMFNHDSERRSGEYLLHRIARGVVGYREHKTKFALSGLDTPVDIGYAPEYMEVVHQMLQGMAGNDDFCVGTGVRWPIESILREALATVGVRAGGDSHLEALDKDAPKFERPGVTPRLIFDDGRPGNLTGYPNNIPVKPSRIETALGWRAKSHAGDVVRRLVVHYKRIGVRT